MENKALTGFKRRLADYALDRAISAIGGAEAAFAQHDYVTAKFMVGMFIEAAFLYEEFIEGTPEGETKKPAFDRLNERCWILNESLLKIEFWAVDGREEEIA